MEHNIHREKASDCDDHIAHAVVALASGGIGHQQKGQKSNDTAPCDFNNMRSFVPDPPAPDTQRGNHGDTVVRAGGEGDQHDE